MEEPPKTERRESTVYDPYKHRNVEKPTTDFGSMAHLLKTSLGSGLLAMPMAFKDAGLVLGSIGTVVLGIICTHCVQMLVASSYILCQRLQVPTLTFAKTAQAAFETGPVCMRKIAKAATIIVNVELILSFVLGNTVYVIFISHAISQVVEHFFEPVIDIRFYVLMIWLPLILMCLLRTLKSLVPFSIIANTCVLISFVITLYYIFRGINRVENVRLITTIYEIPLFISTVIFAMEGIGTILPIENEMKNPEHFLGAKGKCGILYISMSIVIVVYGLIGFFGYLQYGETVGGSITLNLPINETLAQSVKVQMGLAIFFTYALQFYVPIQIIYGLIMPFLAPKWHELLNLLVRAGLVSLTVVASLVIPNLEIVITLVGAICFSMLGLLLPALIDTLIRWPNMGKCKWRLWKNIFIMIVSLISMGSGTYWCVVTVIYLY